MKFVVLDLLLGNHVGMGNYLGILILALKIIYCGVFLCSTL